MSHSRPTPLQLIGGMGLCLLVAAVISLPTHAGNLVRYGDAFEQWSTFRGTQVVANAGLAPDGSSTADQVVDSSTENGARIYSNVITADGGAYVFSCYLKSGTLSQAKLTIAEGSGASVRAYSQPTLTADWQRISVSLPKSVVGETLRVELYPGTFDKNAGYVWAWGAQFESGTSPTPYVSGGSGSSPPADTTPPAAPQGLSAQWLDTGVQVRWTANSESDLAGYRLQRSPDGSSFANLAQPSTASYLDSAVTAGSTYYYRVAAADGSGNVSAYSATTSVQVPAPGTGGVTAPSTGVNLIDYPEEFELWGSFREARAVANAGPAPNSTVTADQVTDSLTQNGAYLYSNTVVADGGAYTLSCYFRAGTLSKAKLAIFDAAGGSIRSYVEPTLTSGWQRFSTTILTSPAGGLLRAGIYAGKFDRESGYVWAWGAQLEHGTSATAYSSSGDANPPADTQAPAAPTGLTAGLSGGSVQLQWRANSESDLAGYRLERGVNSTTSFSALAAPTPPGYTDSSTPAGNSYSYRVCAVDATGNVSTTSAVVTVAVPLPNPTPSGALNVVDFGANPASGGDDAAAIQAAFDAAAAQNKDVYLPAGHYWISRTVSFRVSDHAVYGDGLTRTTVAGNTNSYNLLQFDRTRGATVRDLRFEGSALNDDTVNVNRAVDCYATIGSHIQRVYCYGAGYLAFDNGGTGTVIEDSVVEDYGRIGYLANDGAVVRRCRFVCRDSWNFTGEMQGIYAPAGRSNVLIEDNEFVNVGAYAVQLWGSQSGVWTEQVTIQRNTFVGCKNVLVIGAGSSGPSYRNVRFLANTIRHSQEKDIRIMKFNGSTADGTELLIEGNVFEDPGASYGFMVINNGDAPVTGVRVRNNQFLCPNRSSYQGILHFDRSSGTLQDVVVEGNLFQDFGHSGTSERSFPAIWLRTGSGFRIQDNTFVHWSGAGAGYDVDGVRFDTGAQDVQIARNVFRGTGRSRCYGVRVTGSGTSANGSITGNQFQGARLLANGVPESGNTLQ